MFSLRNLLDTLYDKVFYTQERVGQGGKVFTIYKFKTMPLGSEKLLPEIIQTYGIGQFDRVNYDSRPTRIGRILKGSFLDELPQLFVNVLLRRNMGLVGVRPIPTYEFDDYPLKEQYMKWKPGLIGQLYADMDVFDTEGRMKSHIKYYEKKEAHPLLTDIEYFFRVFYNIIFRKVRGL